MKIKTLARSLMPGIFLMGYCIGTGSVTAMAKAGADYGMSLLWAVFLSCAITYFLINLYGRFTIITGETALEACRRHIHPAAGIFFIVALGVNVSGSIIGVMGIISDVCYELSKSIAPGGIAPVYFAVFFIAVVYLIFFHGGIAFFEKILALLVAIMSACFIANFFILMPAPVEIVRGMIPNIPGTDDNAYLVVASMVGTTVFSGLFIMRTTLVKEAKWTMEDLRLQRSDALFSATGMFVISASIMGAAAGTLHIAGTSLENVSEMVTLLKPVAGLFAIYIFTLGLVAAGVSSQFPNVMLVPWLVNDYQGKGQNMKRWQHRAFVFFISLLGLIVPILHAKPVAVMIASQAFGALILPATVGAIFYLGNKHSLMREHCFSKTTNFLLVLILGFSLFMSYLSFTGLKNIL